MDASLTNLDLRKTKFNVRDNLYCLNTRKRPTHSLTTDPVLIKSNTSTRCVPKAAFYNHKILSTILSVASVGRKLDW